jgi:hypothetical protein
MLSVSIFREKFMRNVDTQLSVSVISAMPTHYNVTRHRHENFTETLSSLGLLTPIFKGAILSGLKLLGSGVRLSPLGTSVTTGPLYQSRTIDDERGAVGGMAGRGN